MDEPLLILEPSRTERHYWADLGRYRELFLILAWRDVAVRYKQTMIGLLWAVLRPVLTLTALTLIFHRVAGLPSEGGAPYPLMVFAAMLPWSFFSSTLSEASNSLINNSNLISKVYFPRLIVPTATLLTELVDMAIGFVLLIGLMAFYRFAPTWHILSLPLFVVLAILTSLGPGLWLAALNTKYRDFRYVIPFIVQFGLYISPVGFSSQVVEPEWRLLYSLNPMVGVIDGFRWAILGGNSVIYWPGFSLSMGVTLLLLWLGISRFRRMEKAFADLV